jgi:hypothetical protein
LNELDEQNPIKAIPTEEKIDENDSTILAF